jgi:dienelactone hydrolase
MHRILPTFLNFHARITGGASRLGRSRKQSHTSRSRFWRSTGRAIPVFLALLVLVADVRAVDSDPGDASMLDRYLTKIAERQLAKRATEIDTLKNPAAIEARQEYIRERLLAEIGGLPSERTPLNARVTGVLDGGDYTVEKVVFESLPRYYVTANVYVPKNAHPPYAAVLGPAGHSSSGKAAEPYQRTWISLAKRGILVLAWDPPGQGERVQYPDASGQKSRFNDGGPGEHTMAGIQCLLTGTNSARYFIWDGMRALDYLLTRGDVDPARIGVAGNSGGGTMTSYLAAFEPRIAVAAPSCYLTSWQELWPRRGPQDAEQVFVNFIADGLNFADFLTAFAPKPLQMATATRDYFPIAGAKATFAEAQRIYRILGAADHVGFFEFDDTHGWSKPRREATYRWFSRWLLNRKDDGIEPDFKIASADALHSTPTGQVTTSYPDAETIQTLNAALAQSMYPKRTAAHATDLAAIVRKRLGIGKQRTPAPSESQGTSTHTGYRAETFKLMPEPGIVLPSIVFVPTDGPARKPAVIYLDPAGATKDNGIDGTIGTLVRAGKIVLAVDPRGYGRSAPHGRIVGGYSPRIFHGNAGIAGRPQSAGNADGRYPECLRLPCPPFRHRHGSHRNCRKGQCSCAGPLCRFARAGCRPRHNRGWSQVIPGQLRGGDSPRAAEYRGAGSAARFRLARYSRSLGGSV